jgi:hypothetical protein
MVRAFFFEHVVVYFYPFIPAGVVFSVGGENKPKIKKKSRNCYPGLPLFFFARARSPRENNGGAAHNNPFHSRRQVGQNGSESLQRG